MSIAEIKASWTLYTAALLHLGAVKNDDKFGWLHVSAKENLVSF